MSDEVLRLADQLERSYRGDAWHGPAVAELLRDVEPELAARVVVPGVHTIWELVEHIRFWMDGSRRRLGGDPYLLPDGSDWPEPPAPSLANWARSLAALETAHRDLMAVVHTLRDDDLARQVPEKPYTAYFLLHGVAQHNLYHAGQIAVLKRAAAEGR
jgi:hypothetical protein